MMQKKGNSLYFITFNYSFFPAFCQGSLHFILAPGPENCVASPATPRLESFLLTSKSLYLTMLWFGVPDFNGDDYKPRSKETRKTCLNSFQFT